MPLVSYNSMLLRVNFALFRETQLCPNTHALIFGKGVVFYI